MRPVAAPGCEPLCREEAKTTHHPEDSRCWQGRGLEVIILYSGAGIAQHIWVANSWGAVLIDAGDGVLRDVLAQGLDLEQLRGVLVTHGHFDHVGGLHSLLGFLRMKGRREPLCIFMPEGCREALSILEGFLESYEDTTPFEIASREIRPHQLFEIGGMSIEPYPVVHCGSTKSDGILDPVPAMGYRVAYKGEIVAISGDTGMCASLKKLVKGADLAVLEAVYEKSEEVDGELLQKVHLSRDLAARIGKLAKEFILVHRGGKC